MNAIVLFAQLICPLGSTDGILYGLVLDDALLLFRLARSLLLSLWQLIIFELNGHSLYQPLDSLFIVILLKLLFEIVLHVFELIAPL